MIDGGSLSKIEMNAVVGLIMTGEATVAQIGGFLIGLRLSGATGDRAKEAMAMMSDHSEVHMRQGARRSTAHHDGNDLSEELRRRVG